MRPAKPVLSPLSCVCPHFETHRGRLLFVAPGVCGRPVPRTPETLSLPLCRLHVHHAAHTEMWAEHDRRTSKAWSTK